MLCDVVCVNDDGLSDLEFVWLDEEYVLRCVCVVMGVWRVCKVVNVMLL